MRKKNFMRHSDGAMELLVIIGVYIIQDYFIFYPSRKNMVRCAEKLYFIIRYYFISFGVLITKT